MSGSSLLFPNRLTLTTPTQERRFSNQFSFIKPRLQISEKDTDNFPNYAQSQLTYPNLSQFSLHPLLKINTVIPFSLFPDTLIIDPKKITIIRRTFFASESVRSILIHDLLHVEVACSLFFATLYFRQRASLDETDSITLKYLPKYQAIKAQRVIQGLYSCIKDNLNLQDLGNGKDLLHQLEIYGSSGDED